MVCLPACSLVRQFKKQNRKRERKKAKKKKTGEHKNRDETIHRNEMENTTHTTLLFTMLPATYVRSYVSVCFRPFYRYTTAAATAICRKTKTNECMTGMSVWRSKTNEIPTADLLYPSTSITWRFFLYTDLPEVALKFENNLQILHSFISIDICDFLARPRFNRPTKIKTTKSKFWIDQYGNAAEPMNNVRAHTHHTRTHTHRMNVVLKFSSIAAAMTIDRLHYDNSKKTKRKKKQKNKNYFFLFDTYPHIHLFSFFHFCWFVYNIIIWRRNTELSSSSSWSPIQLLFRCKLWFFGFSLNCILFLFLVCWFEASSLWAVNCVEWASPG